MPSPLAISFGSCACNPCVGGGGPPIVVPPGFGGWGQPSPFGRYRVEVIYDFTTFDPATNTIARPFLSRCLPRNNVDRLKFGTNDQDIYVVSTANSGGLCEITLRGYGLPSDIHSFPRFFDGAYFFISTAVVGPSALALVVPTQENPPGSYIPATEWQFVYPNKLIGRGWSVSGVLTTGNGPGMVQSREVFGTDFGTGSTNGSLGIRIDFLA